jgi:membrane-associated phospholipid phosphatase
LSVERPKTHFLPLTIGAACTSVAFVVLALQAHVIPYFPIDLSITHYVQTHELAWLNPFVSALNALGFPPVVDIVYGAVIAVMFFMGRRWDAGGVVVSAVGASGFSWLTKWLVARPRPPSDLVHVQHHVPNPAFPAGHVAAFTAFCGFLCYLAWLRLEASWRRTTLIVFLTVAMLLMGLSRVQSGEHWPSDVLGGYLLGVSWLSVTAILHERRVLARESGAPNH